MPKVVLLGHDCPLGAYPCVVIPVGRVGEQLVVIYSSGGQSQLIDIPANSQFVQHSAATDRMLKDFDWTEQGLFAFSEQSIICYTLNDQRKFFAELLQSPRANSIDSFYRLSLARETQQHDLVEAAYAQCILRIRSDSPQFASQWIRQNKPEWIATDTEMETFKSQPRIPSDQWSKGENWLLPSEIWPVLHDVHRPAKWGRIAEQTRVMWPQGRGESPALAIESLGEMQAEVGGIPVRILPPSLDQSFYECSLEQLRGGPRLSATWTYDLSSSSPTRRFLRIDSKSASSVWNLEQFEGFRKLQESMESRSEAVGRIRSTKQTVLRLLEGEHLPKGLGITAHHFGAVPVILLPSKIRSADTDIDLQVAVYPSLSKGMAKKRSPVQLDLLASFRVRLDILLQSYLEDVAAEFDAIHLYSSQTDSYRRLKKVEEILAKSVKTKLDLIFRHLRRDSSSTAPFPELAFEIWERFKPAIIQAAYARILALYLINQLYPCIGVWSQAEKYVEQWYDLIYMLRRLGEDVDSLLKNEVYLITEVISRTAAAAEHFEDLRPAPESPSWLVRFFEFAAFVRTVKADNTQLKPQLFIAGHYQSREGTRIRAAIARAVVTQRSISPAVALTELADQNDLVFAERMAKAHIWRSHVVLAFLGKQMSVSHFDWVAREVEHSILIDRPVYMFVERGAEHSESVEKIIEKVDALRRLKEGRRTLNVVPGYTLFEGYTPNDDLVLNHEAQIRLIQVIENSERIMVHETIFGFLAQFAPIHQIVIGAMFLVISHGMKKRELVRKLSEALATTSSLKQSQTGERAVERLFKGTWRSLEDRSLIIRNRRISLLSRQNQIYVSNLRRVLEALAPSATKGAIDEYYRSTLNEIQRRLVQRTGDLTISNLKSLQKEDSLIQDLNRPPVLVVTF